MQTAQRTHSMPRASGLFSTLAALTRPSQRRRDGFVCEKQGLQDPAAPQRKRAIHGLGKYLGDERHQDQALNLLCAFIRQHAPRYTPVLTKDPTDWAEWGASVRARLPSDIELALTMVARYVALHPNGARPDLSDIRLAALFLGQRNLSRVTLQDSSLAGANLMHTRMNDTRLFRTDLRGAKLDGAQMQGALLADTQLLQASMVRTNLSHARLIHADLRQTRMTHANLRGAFLWRSAFDETTDLTQITLTGAALRDLDLRQTGINATDMWQAFGDVSVLLPDNITPHSALWPDHWSRKQLGHDEFRDRWRRWQAKIGFQSRQNPQ